MPVMDRSIGEPPPFVVVVQGPPQVYFISQLVVYISEICHMVILVYFMCVVGWEVSFDKMSCKVLYKTQLIRSSRPYHSCIRYHVKFFHLKA